VAADFELGRWRDRDFACATYAVGEAAAETGEGFWVPCPVSMEEHMACVSAHGWVHGAVAALPPHDGPAMKRVWWMGRCLMLMTCSEVSHTS